VTSQTAFSCITAPRVFHIVLGICLLLSPLCQAATPEQVDHALAKAKSFLYSQMKNGNWETVQKRDPKGERWQVAGGQWGGLTSICVYALLAAGEDPQDPKLAPSIAWLKKAEIIGTYALAMRCQVWSLLPHTPEIRSLAKLDRDRIQGGYCEVLRKRGTFLYTYLSTKHEQDLIDHSVSQFGVLSMWACARMGIEMPANYWQDQDIRWSHDQQPDGGWFYSDKAGGADHPGEQASMTAAGVATLFITQDYVHQKDGIHCAGNLKNDNIDKGLKWMADHTADWAPANAGYGGFSLPGYTLYGVERIGVASGLKYFGTVDWYQFGADWCVSHQDQNSGSWGGNYPNTALCMLFLARGRAPVLINKIEYNDAADGKPGPWNQRPRDVANFVRWMSEQTERDINWQVSNLEVPEDELHDAPFLYLSGNKELNLKPEQVDKLRAFINHGGMILFNADCQPETPGPFAASVIKLGKQMFPDYEFRNLPESHPLFSDQQYPPAHWKTKVTLRGLSNGVRELMLLMPGDPAKNWQLQETNGTGKEESYQATDDIILYGTDKTNLLVKGQSFLIKPDPKITAANTVKIARLKYTGNWDPEPGGWDRLSALLHNNAKMDVATETVELTDKPITGFTIAHLTGTSGFNLSTVQLQSLKNFVQAGGTLIVDCAGGSSEFATSAEAMLNKLFPGGLKDPLPATDPIYTAGFPKTEIRYRHYARVVLGNVRSPQIKGIHRGLRVGVYYSRYDLSAGLVGEPVDGIVGYDPDTASTIMSGIILQTAGRK
jgi:hypothetical protein